MEIEVGCGWGGDCEVSDVTGFSAWRSGKIPQGCQLIVNVRVHDFNPIQFYQIQPITPHVARAVLPVCTKNTSGVCTEPWLCKWGNKQSGSGMHYFSRST